MANALACLMAFSHFALALPVCCGIPFLMSSNFGFHNNDKTSCLHDPPILRDEPFF